MSEQKYNPDQVLNDIHSCIRWFSENEKSTNIAATSEKLDRFNILLARFNELVMDAYDVEAEFEDDYKISYAKSIKELTDSGMSVNKAENEATVSLADKKKQWREATSVYKRFKSRLDRFDKIGDGKKQKISVSKMVELKNV